MNDIDPNILREKLTQQIHDLGAQNHMHPSLEGRDLEAALRKFLEISDLIDKVEVGDNMTLDALRSQLSILKQKIDELSRVFEAKNDIPSAS